MKRMRWLYVVMVLVAVGVIVGVIALRRSGRDGRAAGQSAGPEKHASRDHRQPAWGSGSTTRQMRTLRTVPAELDGQVRIVGHVLSPEGLPLADAEVICASEHGNVHDRTDVSGRFERTMRPAPEFVLLAQWPSHYHSVVEQGVAQSEYAPTLYGPFQVGPDHETRGIEIVLARGASFSGRVTDERGAPIEGAYVFQARAAAAEEEADSLAAGLLHDWRWATTTADGGYRRGRLAAGRCEVYADHGDYLRSEVRTVTLAEGHESQNVDFVLKDGVAISGRVIAWDDEPLAGAVVSADVEDSGDWFGRVGGAPGKGISATDAEGRFVVQGLKPGSYTLRVCVGDVSAPLCTGQHVAPTHGLDLKTCSPPRIKGRVIDKVTRQPVEEFWAGTDPGYSWDRCARWDEDSETMHHADGRFELVCGPGRYTLHIYQVPGYTAAQIDANRCLEGLEPQELLVELTGGTTLLFYPTSAEDGRLVPGLYIHGDGAFVGSVETDENGLGRLDGVPPGKHTFELSHPDFAYQKITVDVAQEEGEQVVDVVLDPGLTIQGRVFSKEDGSAVPNAAVFLVSPEGLYQERYDQFRTYSAGPPFEQIETHADADGRFALTHVASMTYGLYARAEGYVPARELVDFTGGVGDEIVVELSRGGRISGSVKTGRGDPVQYVRVAVGPSMPGLPSSTRTDADGHFEFVQVEPAAYEVGVEVDGLQATHAVDVREDEEARVEIVLDGATLAGRITRNDEPVADEYVQLAAMGGSLGAARTVSGHTRTDERGEYRFDNLTKGHYLLCVGGLPGFGGSRSVLPGARFRPVSISQQDERLDIELGGSGVSGTVCKADKSPVRGARVTLLPIDDGGQRPVALAMGRAGEPRTAGADLAGAFSFDGVMPGRYRMVVTKDGYAAHVAEIEKRDGEALSGVTVMLQKDTPIPAVVSVDKGELPYSVRIAVCDKDGRLVCRTDWMLVGEDGLVWVDGLCEGRYTLLASDQHHAVCRREVTVTEQGAPEVRFEFVEGRTIAVEVTDASGAPVPAASLMLDPGGDSALAAWFTYPERTDADGKAAFGRVTDGAYTLWVLRDGYKETSVRIEAAETDQPISVTLKDAQRE
ncbi:MAG: carboxypeptidase regulatory-like domain-containing protein [Verrucomicrobia bacterium]|nr:carboxypeptidase regulatory-like domain-containing protein [Verrucomicrobiota bacterium]